MYYYMCYVFLENQNIQPFARTKIIIYMFFLYILKEIADTLGFTWMTRDGLPPKDEPVCGFFGERCTVNLTGMTLFDLPYTIVYYLVMHCFNFRP